jgi:hypothetical protein
LNVRLRTKQSTAYLRALRSSKPDSTAARQGEVSR